MDDQGFDFRKTLLQVDCSLNPDEFKDLVFLCSDLVLKDLSSLSSATELFELLRNKDLLSSHSLALLVELLRLIKRNDLIQRLGLNSCLQSSHISPYRRMLYELAENASDAEIKDIKFVLGDDIIPRKKQHGITMLQMFLEMEKAGHLDDGNLGKLENTLDMFPHLKKIICEFKKTRGAAGQETQMGNPNYLYSSVTTKAVQPESLPRNENIAYEAYHQDLQSAAVMSPPSYSQQSQSSVMPQPLVSFSPSVDGPMASMSLSETSRATKVKDSNDASILTAEDKSQSSSEDYTLGEYDMKGEWRGFCMIINNHNFTGDLSDRDGTEVDERSLVAVFQWLGFTTEILKNCSGDGIINALKDLRSRDHSQADCVVVCVLSHGYEGGVYGVDWRRGHQSESRHGSSGKVTTRELIESLYPQHCPSLSQKPKLFFVQACQGEIDQPAFSLQSDSSKRSLDMETSIVSDAHAPSIPAGADFLLAMSTVPHYTSFREKSKGTWFIQSLCTKLQQLVPKDIDLLSILTEVNNDVSRKASKSGSKKQMPQPAYTLTKRVVFPRPKTLFTS